jgi:hypothetical protein
MLRAGVSLRCSSPRAHRALIALSTCFPDSSCSSFLRPDCGRYLSSCPRYRLAGGHRADPGGEAPAGTPGVVRLARGTRGRDAGTHPGPAAACGDRGQPRPRSPQGEAVRNSPHGACIPRTYVPGSGAPLGHSPPSLPRRRVRGACRRAGDRLPLRPVGGRPASRRRRVRRAGPARPCRPVPRDLPRLGIGWIRRS